MIKVGGGGAGRGMASVASEADRSLAKVFIAVLAGCLLTTRFDSRTLRGRFGAAEGLSQQPPVLHEAAGFGIRILQDAGGDQGGWSVADGPRHQI